MKILVLFESNCGGETIATEAISAEIIKYKNITVKNYRALPLFRTNFHSFWLWHLYSIISWLRIIRRNHQYDWIYTTTYTAGVAAAILKPFSHYNICWHFHGNRVPATPAGLVGITYITQWLKYTGVKALHNFFLKSAAAIFVPSKTSTEILKAQFPGLMTKNMIVVPNGVDRDKFFPVTAVRHLSLRRKYDILKSAKLILSIGRLEKHKRIELLLDVVELLSRDLQNLKLLLVHPKPQNMSEIIYQRKILALTQNKGLNHLVNFITQPENIAEVYQLSDLVISLSQLEYFSLIFLEAFAARILFMGMGVGESGSLLAQIDQRLVLRTSNAGSISKQIKRLLLMPLKDRHQLSKEGYDLLHDYTWKKSARLVVTQLTNVRV